MSDLSKIPLVILAGGYGTRIMELSHLIPKPMIKIGKYPILLHIMKYYSHFGVKDFIICGGYKCSVIKEYFKNFYLENNDVEINLKNNELNFLTANYENWSIKIIDTGEDTETGGRIKEIKKYIKSEFFYMTYGDGLSDVNIYNLTKFHLKNNKLATLTAISPRSRFGLINFKNKSLIDFTEKPNKEDNFINAGFFVLSKKIFNFIKDKKTNFEKDTLKILSKKKLLTGYKHNGFWQCMDTQRDRINLEKMWNMKSTPWKKWK